MENMNDVKTPKEYKIKKIEELKENLPDFWDELIYKSLCYLAVILNESAKTNMHPLFSILPITGMACFINIIISKHRGLMEIDRLETELKLDEATENEFRRILENKKQELTKLNKENNSRFVVNCAIGVISIISACYLSSLNADMASTLLTLTGAYGFLGFVEKFYEMKEINSRINQIGEKQKLNEFNRTRKL